jgi:hypothetical protein
MASLSVLEGHSSKTLIDPEKRVRNVNHQMAVAHDDWCGIFAGQRCDGHLAIKLQWSQPAAA